MILQGPALCRDSLRVVGPSCTSPVCRADLHKTRKIHTANFMALICIFSPQADRSPRALIADLCGKQARYQMDDHSVPFYVIAIAPQRGELPRSSSVRIVPLSWRGHASSWNDCC